MSKKSIASSPRLDTFIYLILIFFFFLILFIFCRGIDKSPLLRVPLMHVFMVFTKGRKNTFPWFECKKEEGHQRERQDSCFH